MWILQGCHGWFLPLSHVHFQHDLKAKNNLCSLTRLTFSYRVLPCCCPPAGTTAGRRRPRWSAAEWTGSDTSGPVWWVPGRRCTGRSWRTHSSRWEFAASGAWIATRFARPAASCWSSGAVELLSAAETRQLPAAHLQGHCGTLVTLKKQSANEESKQSLDWVVSSWPPVILLTDLTVIGWCPKGPPCS